MKIKLFISGLALLAATAFVGAQTPDTSKANRNSECSGVCRCGRFIDSNKNGTCDKVESTKDNVSGHKGKDQHKEGTAANANKSKNPANANKKGVYDNRKKK